MKLSLTKTAMVSDCDGAGIAAVQGEEEEEIRTYTVTLHA
jgi:hypothetical protein